MSELEFDLSPVLIKLKIDSERVLKIDPIEAYLGLELLSKKLSAEKGVSVDDLDDADLAPAIQQWVLNEHGMDVSKQVALRVAMAIYGSYEDVKKKLNPWNDLPKSATSTVSPPEAWTEMPPISSGDTKTEL